MNDDIDRPGRDRRDQFGDGAVIQQERHEQAVRARLRIGDGAGDALARRHAGHAEILAAPDQHQRRIDPVDRFARGRDPLHRQRQVIERAARPVLDRQGRDAGLRRQRNIRGDILGHIGKAIFEIGVDRQVGRRDQHLQMRQHRVAAQFAIILARRPGRAGTGRRDCAKALLRQPHRTARVPGIGQ